MSTERWGQFLADFQSPIAYTSSHFGLCSIDIVNITEEQREVITQVLLDLGMTVMEEMDATNMPDIY